MLPVIAALARHVRVSVDTRKAAVAEAAVAAGATLINDVSATLWPVAAAAGVGLGGHAHAGATRRPCRSPRTTTTWWPRSPPSWSRRADPAEAAGVTRSGSTRASASARRPQHNLLLLRHLDRLVATGWPVAHRHQPQVLPRPAGRRARRGPGPGRRPARGITGHRRVGHVARRGAWSGCTTCGPPSRPPGSSGRRHSARPEPRSGRRHEGQVGARASRPGSSRGSSRTSWPSASAPAATPATTGGSAARRRSCGCGARGSPGSCRCSRRPTTCTPTTSSASPGPTSPSGPTTTPTWCCPDLYRQLREWLAAGERVLLHQEELGDRLMGVVAGYLRWSGLVPTVPRPSPSSSRSCTARWDPAGRELVALAPDLAGHGD